MRIGTKSILFGAHCFFIHPFFVALAWWRLFGFKVVKCGITRVEAGLLDWRLWICFIVHDLGYWGSPNMDGAEGGRHPEMGARIAHRLFDKRGRWGGFLRREVRWYEFVRYHSRYLAKLDHRMPSVLCLADKLAIAVTPAWLYVPMARLSGEIREYRSRETRSETSKGWAGVYDSEGSDYEWFRRVGKWAAAYVAEHRDGRMDTWTPERSGN